MRPPEIITDEVFNDRVSRLITTGGDSERAGVTLEEVADMIHTRRMRINPSAGDPIETKAPKVKAPKTKITGPAVDDLLG